MKEHRKKFIDIECPKAIKINGIVLPKEWNEKGDIESIGIFTFDEEEYLVEKNKIGKQLMSYIRQEVHVSGTLQIKKDNTKKIIVKEFSVKNS
ncbi:MAG: hypothetical protein SVY10_03960 [Thermodesulfobacteriota bacterium]|nr:hypothetical protein [Thermodesulfobacteriota bacterium]